MGEELFLTVNDTKVDLKLALNCSRGLDDEIIDGMVNMVVGRQYAAANGFAVTDEELQKAVDEYRYLMGLESVDDFNQYLKDRRIDLLSFQTAMEGVLLRGKATDAIPDDEVDAYLAENQLDLEKVDLYHMRLTDEDTAQEIKSLLDEEDENFLALASEHSTDELTAKQGGYVGPLGRSEMTAEIEAEVFSAAEGTLSVPLRPRTVSTCSRSAPFSVPTKPIKTCAPASGRSCSIRNWPS